MHPPQDSPLGATVEAAKNNQGQVSQQKNPPLKKLGKETLYQNII